MKNKYNEFLFHLQCLKQRITNFYCIKKGYIDKDFCPIKCTCGSTDLEECYQDYIENTLIEYEVRCKKCGKKLGHWAYGYWERW